MAVYAEKHHGHKVSTGEAGDTTLTGGGRTQGVGKFLQGGGTCDSIVWIGDVGHFGVNVKEVIGDTHTVFLQLVTGKRVMQLGDGTWETPGAEGVREAAVTQ